MKFCAESGKPENNTNQYTRTSRSLSEEKRFMDGLQRLRSVCSGYERLQRYMNAAANVYAMAQETAAEQIDF